MWVGVLLGNTILCICVCVVGMSVSVVVCVCRPLCLTKLTLSKGWKLLDGTSILRNVDSFASASVWNQTREEECCCEGQWKTF